MIYYKVEQQEDSFRLYEPVRNPEYNRKTESVFAQCNGYLGVRAALEIRQLDESRGTFIGGFYHRAGAHEVTELVNCPDVTEFRVRFNGRPVRLDCGSINHYERSLGTRTGELVSRINFSDGVRIETRRFASMHNKKLFCHEFRISSQEGGALELTTGINGKMTNSGVSHFDRIEARVFENQRVEQSAGGAAGILFGMECGCDDGQLLRIMTVCSAKKAEVRGSFHLERRSIYEDIRQELLPGETWTICRYTLYDTTETSFEAMAAIINKAGVVGYQGLFQRHQEVFEHFWDMATIVIDGASPEEQAAIQFAQYHLAGMVPWESHLYSVAAKGLTGEGYKGHVFWDTEIFIMPFFTLMFPEVSKNLLRYRYHGLIGARKKAAEYGYLGAMYPWEAAVTGQEETPLYAAIDIHTGKAAKVWSGIKEHHVTADVIYGLLYYWQVTGDTEFMEQYGYEMILETAVFWVSRAERNGERERFEIRDIIGPDEYNEHIDNNAYTNYMAYENVKAASHVLKQNTPLIRQYQEAGWEGRFEYFLRHLYLPQPNEEQIIPQDDTFLDKKRLADIGKYRDGDVRQLILKDYSRMQVVGMQVLKQADVVMLLVLLPERFDDETVKKNVEFYEALTTHDSSLSYCVHAEAEARIGEMELAAEFFQKALEIDLGEGYKDSVEGIHGAAIGGILNCILKGFAGVRTGPEGLMFHPHLPAVWKSIRFSVMDHGERKQVTITKNAVEYC